MMFDMKTIGLKGGISYSNIVGVWLTQDQFLPGGYSKEVSNVNENYRK